jgi:hypothetical protein
MGGGHAAARGADQLSAQAEALLLLRRLCRQYHALPSAVLAEDGGLLLQLLRVDTIVIGVEAEATRQAEDIGPMTWDIDEGVSSGASW